MSNEKRQMILQLIVSECTAEQADAILSTVITLAGASADLIDSPVKIIACPPHAPRDIQEAATRVMYPKSNPCLCAGCVANEKADREGRNTMVPLEVKHGPDGRPDYAKASRLLAELEAIASSRNDEEQIPSTEPAPVPQVNVRRPMRGPVS